MRIIRIIVDSLWRIIAALFFLIIGACIFPFIFIGMALTTITEE